MKTILLVEDDPFITDIYSSQFKAAGYKVDTAGDGQVALDKIRNTRPDLVVLDIDLPKIDGSEILKLLRSDESTKHLKVVVLSNYNEEYIGQKYNINTADFGVSRYFLKVETSIDEIKKAIKEILGE